MVIEAILHPGPGTVQELMATLRRSDAALARCSLNEPTAEVRGGARRSRFVALPEPDDRSRELLILHP